MKKEHPRTELVYEVICELIEQGKSSVRPGDVNSVLRERGAPLGTWEVRAEFTQLERIGRITCDEDTGNWHLAANASLKNTG